MIANFAAALAFVWAPGRDSPADGYHTTPGDPGGGTFGGVIEATWADAVNSGIVRGPLVNATIKQLTAVLQAKFWGDACDALPAGLDLLLFNGRMMTGRFPWIMQQCLGFMTDDDVDGRIGPQTLHAAAQCDGPTLIDAISGSHCAYLRGLSGWAEFGGGWSARLVAAKAAAHALTDKEPAPTPLETTAN
jgi:lysozyme family protein